MSFHSTLFSSGRHQCLGVWAWIAKVTGRDTCRISYKTVPTILTQSLYESLQKSARSLIANRKVQKVCAITSTWARAGNVWFYSHQSWKQFGRRNSPTKHDTICLKYTIAYKMPYLVKARSFLSLADKMLVSLSKGTAWQVWQTRDGRKSASLMTSGPLHE